MQYQQYQQLFNDILNSENPPQPYNDEMYFNFTKLNQSRMRRWDKQLRLEQQLTDQLKHINTAQHWIIITEPWCGDAAHIVPFLVQMASYNKLITYDIQLRDSEPFLITSYLTDGTKSIPKLIVRDHAGQDIFTWGPRPEPARDMAASLKASGAEFETIKMALQNWYNNDKGASLSKEIAELIGNAVL